MHKNINSDNVNARYAIILLILNLLMIGTAFSQSVEDRIAEWNTALGSEYEVSFKGKNLSVKAFREGKQMKVEQVNVFDLDIETLHYSEVDATVSVKCYSNLDGCVQQTLLLDKKKDYRKRLVFEVLKAESGTAIEGKLRTLLVELIKTK
ncbi:MAG: hypothetical protein K9G41_11045 [Flavobacteriales bacterium]|nr:hypothetical protein [Flavobacteriales bacterium]